MLANHGLDERTAETGSGYEMNFALVGIIVAWLCGLLFLAGQHLNNIRLVLNSLAPEARTADRPLQPKSPPTAVTALSLTFSIWDLLVAAAVLLAGRSFGLDRSNAYRITGIDPALLTEAGRVHLKRTVRQERILIAWMLVGFLLLVWASTDFLIS